MAAPKGKKKQPAGKAKGKAPSKNGKGKAKAAPSKAVSKDASLNIGGLLVLSLFGIGLAATGLAVLDRGLELGIVRGRHGIAEAAIGLGPSLLAATIGLIIAWIMIPKMRLIGGLIAAAILVGGATAAASFLAPQLFQAMNGSIGAEGRQAALKGNFMHQMLAANSFQAGELPTVSNDPDAKLLMGGIGALGVFDPDVYQRMDSNLFDMAETVTGRALDPDSAWASFRLAADETVRDYERYRNAANNYLTVINSLDQQIAQLWAAVVQAARLRWADYQRRQDSVLTQLRVRVPDLRDFMVVYFRVKQRGGRIDELQSRYEALSTELFGEIVDPQTWCGPTGCPGDEAFLSQRGSQVLSQSFARQNNQIALGMYEAQYIAHPSVVAAIRTEVQQSGVTLPEDWALTVAGRDQLVAAARRDIPTAAEQTYERAIRGWFETELPPDLSYADFVAQEGIQNIIRRTIDLPTDLRIDPGVDRATFNAEIYPRIIRPPAEALAADIMAPLDDFDPGAGINRLSTEVTKALNTHFSIALLLFSGAFAGLVGGVVGLSAAAAVIWRAVGGAIKFPAERVAGGNKLIGMVAVGSILGGFAVPLFLPIGMAGYPGYGQVVQPLSAAPPAGHALDWTMRFAGTVQPFGAISRGVAFGNSDFGLIPAPPEGDAGFGFVFEIDDDLPEMMQQPDNGPSGIKGIADRLDNLIDSATGGGGDAQ